MPSLMPKELTTFALAAASLTLLCGGLVWVWYRRSTKPKKSSVGKISNILIYPIKSGPPLSLSEAECTESGLKFKTVKDRQFILVDNDQFITSSQNLKLTTLTLAYDVVGNSLILSAPDKDDLVIPLLIPSYDPQTVREVKWFDKTATSYVIYGEKYSKWFTEFLGQPCDLGYFHPELPIRKVNPLKRFYTGNVHPDSRVLYNNSHPYLLCSQSSLDDLNTRIAEPVDYDAFRPNLVVNTESHVTPYEEDSWSIIQIGSEASLFNERACPRCPRIYIDNKNHFIKRDKEPMTTLLKYRRGQAKEDKYRTVFGVNLSSSKNGMISLHDPVVVTYLQS